MNVIESSRNIRYVQLNPKITFYTGGGGGGDSPFSPQENVQNFIKVHSRKLKTLNCDSHEPTKVLVSNAVAYTCFNELHIAKISFN